MIWNRKTRKELEDFKRGLAELAAGFAARESEFAASWDNAKRSYADLEAKVSYVLNSMPQKPIMSLPFPKWLTHPEGTKTRFCPVVVHTVGQEEEYKAKGYVVETPDDPAKYILMKLGELFAKRIDRHFRMVTARCVDSEERISRIEHILQEPLPDADLCEE